MIERLSELLVPPSEPILRPTAEDWAVVEGRITPLPSDYRAFLDIYGLGSIDGFLSVLSPSAPEPLYSLASQLETQATVHGALRSQVGHDVIPYQMFPEFGGLIPWGTTTNGDVCYWVTSDSNPDRWAVFIEDSEVEWEQYPGTMSTFVQEVLQGTYTSAIFPSDFPTSKPACFDPWHEPFSVAIVFADSSRSHADRLAILHSHFSPAQSRGQQVSTEAVVDHIVQCGKGWRLSYMSRMKLVEGAGESPSYLHSLTVDAPPTAIGRIKDAAIELTKAWGSPVVAATMQNAEGVHQIWADIVGGADTDSSA